MKMRRTLPSKIPGFSFSFSFSILLTAVLILDIDPWGFHTKVALADDTGAAQSDFIYPEVDQSIGEELQNGEIEIATKIAKIIEQAVLTRSPPGGALRDAHAKSHGCVKGNFLVNHDIPEGLAKGVFIPGKIYPVWIRYSNGKGLEDGPSSVKRADIKKDSRGMAIKLLGIEGKTLLQRDEMAGTQDFIMMSSPVFFVDDPEDYLSLIKLLFSDNKVKQKLRTILIPFSIGLKSTKTAAKIIGKQIDNPLKTRFWSTVPYQLGTGPDSVAVKYSARSCTPHTKVLEEDPHDDFLRHAMRDTLSAGPACVEFLVQPRTQNSMSVEDSITEWTEEEAPFYKVATITIPKQNFDTPEQNTFCENLSFSPWHALPEHRPLGSVNRMRKVIYAHISRVRREANGASLQEP